MHEMLAARPRKRETNVVRSFDRRRRQLVTLLKEAIKRETTAIGGSTAINSIISLIAAR